MQSDFTSWSADACADAIWGPRREGGTTLLFAGKTGTGKTTVAQYLLSELGAAAREQGIPVRVSVLLNAGSNAPTVDGWVRVTGSEAHVQQIKSKGVMDLPILTPTPEQAARGIVRESLAYESPEDYIRLWVEKMDRVQQIVLSGPRASEFHPLFVVLDDLIVPYKHIFQTPAHCGTILRLMTMVRHRQIVLVATTQSLAFNLDFARKFIWWVLCGETQASSGTAAAQALESRGVTPEVQRRIRKSVQPQGGSVIVCSDDDRREWAVPWLGEYVWTPAACNSQIRAGNATSSRAPRSTDRLAGLRDYTVGVLSGAPRPPPVHVTNFGGR